MPIPARLLLSALLACSLGSARAGDATLFDDTFTGPGPELGAAWAASGWHLDGSGNALESEGGYATAVVGRFAATSYSVEARVAIARFLGPSPGDAVSLVVGQPHSTEPDGLRVVYHPWRRELSLVRHDGSGGEPAVSLLATAAIDLGEQATGWKLVADAATATVGVFIDSGGGYPATPTLMASGVAVPALGWTGLVRESQSPGAVTVARFTVRQPLVGATVARFTLIDADTDQPVPGQETLLDGAVLNLALLPHRRLSVRAETTGGTVGSVRFAYDGNPTHHTENFQPYALAGDAADGTDYLPWEPQVGDHHLTATPFSGAQATGVAGKPLTVRFTVIDRSAPFAVAVNFQPAAAAVPDGYVADSGAPFALRGSGLVYGWSRTVPDTRERNSPAAPDQRHDTLIHLQKTGSDPVWEIAVPDGTYLIELVAGDPSHVDSVYRLSVEGFLVVDAVPTAAARFAGAGAMVTVRDGRITLRNAAGAVNNKLCFIIITPASGNG